MDIWGLFGMDFDWSDEATLEALHLRDVEGFSSREISEGLVFLFGGKLSASSVRSRLSRICREADNYSDFGDGALYPGWWRDGISRRLMRRRFRLVGGS